MKHRVLVVAVAAVALFVTASPSARRRVHAERHRVPPAHVPGAGNGALLRRLRRRPPASRQRPHGQEARPRARGERRDDHVRARRLERALRATCSSSPAPTAGSTGTSTSTTTRPVPTTARTRRSGASRPASPKGVHVKRGQFIAYMGDSGEAETTDPHLHFELHRPDDTFIDPYTSLRLAQGAGANGLCSYPTNPTPHPSAAAGPGFWTLDARRHGARLRQRAEVRQRAGGARPAIRTSR